MQHRQPPRTPGAAASLYAAVCALALALLATACGREEQPAAAQREVVVYTALDREYSEPIFDLFQQRTGITVRPVYDSEAVKTVGLVNRLIAERNRPAADVFWNNEIVRSIQLAREGLVEPYRSHSAADIPAAFKDPQGFWTGFAARARVFIVPAEMPEAELPARLEDLADPARTDSRAFAKPLFGTTNTHAAVICAAAGEAGLRAYMANLLANAVMLPGNGQVRDAVVAGEVRWGLTDTDDAHSAIEDGAAVRIVYPKGGPEGEGALLIPNTVVLMKGGPNPAEGRELIDFLLSREVETLLAASRSAQMPVREGIPFPPGLPPLAPGDVLAVDWDSVYDKLATAQSVLVEMLPSER
ncbi:MAG: extracellular solute-binding protein [Candidatus Sumerlaeia bacterium]|nr:extracellular solute-binding protein [Candidatus Sumerlaeia bacterium]